MILISLLQKFGSQSFVTSTEVSQMKLRHVNTIRRDLRNVPIQKQGSGGGGCRGVGTTNVKTKIIAFVTNFK